MINKQLIATRTLCLHYNIEVSFVNTLNEMGLIQVVVIEKDQFIHQDEIGAFEKIIRLHQDLNINMEGIDIVLNLLEKERRLMNELNTLKNKLRLYEDD